MKTILIACFLSLMLTTVHSQTLNTMGTLNNQTLGSVGWINLGTLTLPQQGYDAVLRFVGGSGYNGGINQNGYTELYIRTSNGASVDANGYGFAATATSYQQSPFVQNIKIVPNAAGGAANQFTIYLDCGIYVGASYYTVESYGGSWTANVTATTDPGTAYVVPFQYFQNSPAYFTSTLAIGTTTPDGYTLAVNGSAVFTQVVVKSYANWPDYVFARDYHLTPLSEVDRYVHRHGHLPEVPPATEVAQKGLDLGAEEALLQKKVEELTLYLIDQQKTIRQLQREVARQKKRVH